MGMEISAGDLLTMHKEHRRNISFTYRPTQYRVEWGKTPPPTVFPPSFHHEAYTGDVPERKRISQ